MNSNEIDRLIERVEGPLPQRWEDGKQFWRLELTREERNLLAAALNYVAQTAATSAECEPNT